jgi:fatty acid desaturase
MMSATVGANDYRPTKRDYSLIGRDAQRAVETGLSVAQWYHTDVPRKQMKELMKRDDSPAIRDTLIWLGILILSRAGGALLWGSSWWCVPFFLVYGVLYGSSTDVGLHLMVRLRTLRTTTALNGETPG